MQLTCPKCKHIHCKVCQGFATDSLENWRAKHHDCMATPTNNISPNTGMVRRPEKECGCQYWSTQKGRDELDAAYFRNAVASAYGR